jgi:uncharacterized protein YhbP (UPF0306 family)
MTLATADVNIPQCAICFYVYDRELQAIIFKSDRKTKHIQNLIKNNSVAATVLADVHEILKIKGLQIEGTAQEPADNESVIKDAYYSKYPFARLIPGDLWLLHPAKMKFTDNTLGFGKKVLWDKQG